MVNVAFKSDVRDFDSDVNRVAEKIISLNHIHTFAVKGTADDLTDKLSK